MHVAFVFSCFSGLPFNGICHNVYDWWGIFEWESCNPECCRPSMFLCLRISFDRTRVCGFTLLSVDFDRMLTYCKLS